MMKKGGRPFCPSEARPVRIHRIDSSYHHHHVVIIIVAVVPTTASRSPPVSHAVRGGCLSVCLWLASSTAPHLVEGQLLGRAVAAA